MIVISNTSPILYFGLAGKLSILKDLYSKIYIPNAVWEEIPSSLRININDKKTDWLVIQNPEKEEFKELAFSLFSILGRGESYAIKTKWITEVLLDAAKNKIIKKFQEFQKIFEIMIENGLWIKKEHYNKILLKAKEILS